MQICNLCLNEIIAVYRKKIALIIMQKRKRYKKNVKSIFNNEFRLATNTYRVAQIAKLSFTSEFSLMRKMQSFNKFTIFLIQVNRWKITNKIQLKLRITQFIWYGGCTTLFAVRMPSICLKNVWNSSFPLFILCSYSTVWNAFESRSYIFNRILRDVTNNWCVQIRNLVVTYHCLQKKN